MHTTIIYRKELFFKAVAFVLLCFFIEIISSHFIKSRAVSIIILVAMLLPILLIPLLLKMFTRQVMIRHDDPGYLIFEIKSRKKTIRKEIVLEKVGAYSIQFPNNRFSAIKFLLKSGSKYEFSFFQKKRHKEDIETDELIKTIREIIDQYNTQADNHSKIAFQPSFYATKTGLYCIIGLSVLLLFAVLLFAFSNEKSLPVTFLYSLLLISQLISKRRKELAYYNTMNQNNELN